MPGTSTDTSVPGPPGGQQPLDEARVETLRAVGREWSRGFGGRREPEVEVTDEVPPHRSRLRRALSGRPLRSAELATEKLGKRVALPVLSSDALSSVAYRTVAAALMRRISRGATMTIASRRTICAIVTSARLTPLRLTAAASTALIPPGVVIR